MPDADRKRATAQQLRPIYLLADSQPLFETRHDRPLLETAVEGLAADGPLNAAYIGASNGDRPEFYEIFEAAVDAVGITDRRMIDSSFGRTDRDFLRRAVLIVLAGGDVRLGWDTFARTGMKESILDRYAKGAVLVGISAGAVQLGRYGIDGTAESGIELFDVFSLVPAVIDTHDERAEWTRLTRTVQSLRGAATGLAIPSGGGAVVHADGTMKPLRRGAHTFTFDGTRVVQSRLPGDADDR